jgi:hypothetical protein
MERSFLNITIGKKNSDIIVFLSNNIGYSHPLSPLKEFICASTKIYHRVKTRMLIYKLHKEKFIKANQNMC